MCESLDASVVGVWSVAHVHGYGIGRLLIVFAFLPSPLDPESAHYSLEHKYADRIIHSRKLKYALTIPKATES